MFWIKTPTLFDQLFQDVIWRMPVTDDLVFITFDDGPHPKTTPGILELLEAFDMKATFFLLGKQIETYPELYQAIKDAGHLTAHHSYSHPNGWHTDKENYLSDISRGSELAPSHYFRPPFGKLTRGQWLRIKEDYQVVMWSLMPEDWRNDIEAEVMLDRLTSKTKAGDIIVLHENDKSHEKISYLLPKYLAYLAEQKLKSERLDYVD